MSWVKFDDQFYSHPKILKAGRDAREVYCVGLHYCAAQLTDGFIPAAALRVIGATAIVDDVQACADALVKNRLWEPVEDGYQVHDYLKYQPSGEQVRQQREKNAERQGRFRDEHKEELKQKRNARRNAVTNGGSNAGSNGLRNGRVTPAPYPSPIYVSPIGDSADGAPMQPDVASLIEGNVVALPVKDATPKSRKAHPDAPLWEALKDALGYAEYPKTRNEQSKWGNTVKQLKATGDATPEEICRRVARMIARWGREYVTIASIPGQWAESAQAIAPSSKLKATGTHDTTPAPVYVPATAYSPWE